MIKHEYLENDKPVNSEQTPIIAIIVTALSITKPTRLLLIKECNSTYEAVIQYIHDITSTQTGRKCMFCF
jgi:hypothetical protein